MCNPAEQSGVEYASDPKRTNGFVSETEHLCTCAAINADTMAETDGATDHLSNSTSEYSGKNVHSSEQENVMKGSCCQIINEEDIRIETMPMDKVTLIDDMLLETTSKWIEEVRFEKKALQPTSKGTALETDTLADISKEFNEQASIKVVNSTIVSCANELGVRETEEVLIDPCEGTGETGMPSHTGDKGEVDDMSLVVGMVGGSVDHSKGPCPETDDAGLVNIPGLMIVAPEVEQVEGGCKQMEDSLQHDPVSLEETKEHIPVDFDESASWIEMRPGTIEGVAEQLATNSEKNPSGVMQQAGQVIKEILVIDENMDKPISGVAMSFKEAAAEHATQSFDDLGQNVVKQGVTFDEAQCEIHQGSSTVSSVHVEATDRSVSKGMNGPELAEFFNNARASKLEEEEIKEQEQVPLMVKLPTKKKDFMESPRSLRMLLFSDETTLPEEKDEKHIKDGEGTGLSSNTASAVESNGNENHTDNSHSTKWHENADSADASSTFSVPMTFSGALTYQGMISYSGQVSYSGSISHRSDSSTSTRSFAFPILASDWNTSPVKMGAPDPRFFRQQRKWHFCFCCRRPSTLFD